ncbi:50S ribosomal protein L24 [Candidatus Beckwithbacteria bacterium RBG_13_35_6]|uniref:Large ribosomal subunit protein uL24 n=1 Tax=Candidatus Beckwithbacteria bacterium RBG_13_35_6 TaxID=1797456 RepID=A0A1F5DFG0_9BACT|nr:MAG: 50S ribosomal protein L24 [Candidatus Beckwithbacteria bacterium RBG_13_35_6]
MKIKKGDNVRIMAGKDKGKIGKVEKVLIKSNKVLVTGINIYKRHLKSRGQNRPSGIIDITKPLPVSSISLICSKCGKPTKIGYLIDKRGDKQRICRKCKGIN